MNDNEFIVKVNNLPNYKLQKYIVARISNGELWFWGTWETEDQAKKIAEEMDGIVVFNPNADKA